MSTFCAPTEFGNTVVERLGPHLYMLAVHAKAWCLFDGLGF